VLLAGRVVQGTGAAMISSAALALLTTLFTEGRERNRALGAWGVVGGAAGASGLIVGGVLTDTLGWEWVFFINLPVALAAGLAAPRLLPRGVVAGPARPLDLPGALMVTLGLGLLLYGLNHGEQAGFSSQTTISLLCAATALLITFIVIERRMRNPIVAFRLFRVPGVAGTDAAAILLAAIIASNLFFTTLYVQRVLGFSALETGMAFLPNSVLVGVGSALTSRLAGRIGTGSVLAAGLGVGGVGALLLAGISAEGSYVTDVLPGFALTGLGLGMAFVAVTIGATAGIDEHDQGLASGVVNTAQQVGFAVGIAVVVAVATAHQETSTGSEAQRLVAGYSAGYLLGAVLAGIAAIGAVILIRARRPRR
jgi:MFS family permease